MPNGAADEMRLGLRRPAYGEPDARALHNMPQAPASLTPPEPAGEELESQAWPAAGRRMLCGRRCVAQTHGKGVARECAAVGAGPSA
jgi:hypothetical protein